MCVFDSSLLMCEFNETGNVLHWYMIVCMPCVRVCVCMCVWLFVFVSGLSMYVQWGGKWICMFAMQSTVYTQKYGMVELPTSNRVNEKLYQDETMFCDPFTVKSQSVRARSYVRDVCIFKLYDKSKFKSSSLKWHCSTCLDLQLFRVSTHEATTYM